MSPANSLKAWLCLILLLAGSSAFALSDDRRQPIELEADSVDINEAAGVSVYQGDVLLRQGSIEIQADRVTVHHQGGKPTLVVAEGKPVRFKQRPDDGKEDIIAQANRMEYHVGSEELVFSGNARVTQGKDSFSSDRIVYDRVKSVVKAGSAAKGKERVRIIIEAPKP